MPGYPDQVPDSGYFFFCQVVVPHNFDILRAVLCLADWKFCIYVINLPFIRILYESFFGGKFIWEEGCHGLSGV